jgi:hypothetical protein
MAQVSAANSAKLSASAREKTFPGCQIATSYLWEPAGLLGSQSLGLRIQKLDAKSGRSILAK